MTVEKRFVDVPFHSSWGFRLFFLDRIKTREKLHQVSLDYFFVWFVISADVLRSLLDRPRPAWALLLVYNGANIDWRSFDDIIISENFSERSFKTVIYYSWCQKEKKRKVWHAKYSLIRRTIIMNLLFYNPCNGGNSLRNITTEIPKLVFEIQV